MSKYLCIPSPDGLRLEEVNPYPYNYGNDIYPSQDWEYFEKNKLSFLTDDPRVVVGQQYPADEYELVEQFETVSGFWMDVQRQFIGTHKFTRQILRRKAEVEKAVEIIDPIKLLKEYQERLNEVYKHTGKLTNIDVDYCLLMTLHDNNIHFTVN